MDIESTLIAIPKQVELMTERCFQVLGHVSVMSKQNDSWGASSAHTKEGIVTGKCRLTPELLSAWFTAAGAEVVSIQEYKAQKMVTVTFKVAEKVEVTR